MLIKALKNIFLFFLIAIIQIAILPNLPGVANKLNFVLVFIIFVAVVYQFYNSVVFAVFLGLIMDLYSGLPFGAMMLSLMVTLYVVYIVFTKLLTNKSFYTLIALTSLGTLVYSLILYGYLYINYFVQTKDMVLIKHLTVVSVQNFTWQLLLNVIAIIVLFLFFHMGSRRFKAVFIDTTKN